MLSMKIYQKCRIPRGKKSMYHITRPRGDRRRGVPAGGRRWCVSHSSRLVRSSLVPLSLISRPSHSSLAHLSFLCHSSVIALSLICHFSVGHLSFLAHSSLITLSLIRQFSASHISPVLSVSFCQPPFLSLSLIHCLALS